MDSFSYLSVLFSVILGLALTEILQGVRRLVLARFHVRFYPPALIWMLVIALIVVQDWWAMFGLRGVHEWSFAMYGSVLLLVTLLYLVAGLSVPEIEPHGVLDMRRSYFANSRWFFAMFGAAVLASLFKGFVFAGYLPLDGNLAFHAIFLIASIIAAATRSHWYHSMFAPIMALSFLAYIALYFARL